ncbi:hypothetical protein NQZ79_g8023 [Umbelopsis isabellina]|nr:hypothetical protein NQZ79_g8023 [Umbelopsis isabellina]
MRQDTAISIDWYDIPMSPISKVLLLCPNVEEFDIDHFPPPHGIHGSHITQDYARLFSSCTKLRTLICGGKGAEGIAKCGARQITTLKLNCPIRFTAVDGIGCNFANLVHLKLAVKKIEVTFLGRLSGELSRFRRATLDWQRHDSITNAPSLNITTSSLSSLHFHIGGINRSWIAHVALRYPKLKRISTGTPGLCEVIDFCEFAQSCSYLSEFLCSIWIEGYAPTAKFFEMLSQSTAGYEGFKKLCLSQTPSFGDQGLHKAAICFGQTLCSLTLLDCNRITSDGLINALETCHNLTSLSLSTKTGMELHLPQMMSHCSRLETLKLKDIGITCTPSPSRISIQTRLKRVQLVKMQTWPAVLDYISAYCSSVSNIDLKDFYTPDPGDDCILLNLPNHHIRDLFIEPFHMKFFAKESQYDAKNARKFLCQHLCAKNCPEDVCDGEWSYELIELKDAVSKFVNLEIRIGQLDDFRLGLPKWGSHCKIHQA